MQEQVKKIDISNNIFPANLTSDDIIRDLINALEIEAQGINNLINNFPKNSVDLVNKILNTSGRIIFSGMGKSGLVAKKLVATFSSIGITSLFLHPAEALHGDLGMVKNNDLFIAISKSGTGQELELVIQSLKSFGNYTALISCGKGYLSNFVDLNIVLPFTKEACQINLAPTTSSTLTMAFGDALGVVVSKIKKFNRNDFARFHPAGALGKRLLLKVSYLMRKETELPKVSLNTSFTDLVYFISSKKLGAAIVVENDLLQGFITDGDLRRAMQKGPEVFSKTAQDIMTKNPKTINQDILAYDALLIMEEFNITSLIVKGLEQKVVGLIHIHDLLKAGITLK